MSSLFCDLYNVVIASAEVTGFCDLCLTEMSVYYRVVVDDTVNSVILSLCRVRIGETGEKWDTVSPPGHKLI